MIVDFTHKDLAEEAHKAVGKAKEEALDKVQKAISEHQLSASERMQGFFHGASNYFQAAVNTKVDYGKDTWLG